MEIKNEPLTPVYIAHPLGTGEQRALNRARAARWAAWAAEYFMVIPIAPWITLAEVWPETDEMRERGLNLDVSLLHLMMATQSYTMNEYSSMPAWLTGGRVSPGMEVEMKEAIEFIDLTYLGEEPPERGTLMELPLPVVKLIRSPPYVARTGKEIFRTKPDQHSTALVLL